MNDSFDRQLRRHLFRFDCPESEVLAEYHSGSLENELREKIAAHLENCVRCREELEAFREFYQNEESGLRKGLEQIIPDKLRKIHHVVRDILTLPQFSPGFAAAGLRGGDDKISRFDVTWNDSKIPLFIKYEKEEENAELKGQFIPPPEFERKLSGALAEVWSDSELLATAIIDETGSFFCSLKAEASLNIRVVGEGETLFVFKLDTSDM